MSDAIKKNPSGKEVTVSRRDNALREIINYGILGLLIFSPLPAASVHEWSILVIQLTVMVMVGAYFLMTEKPKINDHLYSIIKWPFYMFLGLLGLICFQVSPLPVFIVKLISPNTYKFQNLFSYDASKAKFMSVSLIPSHTLYESLEIISYFLFGFLIILTVTKRKQIYRIIYVILGMGIFNALYGIFQLSSNSPRILFYKKVEGFDAVSGTFINRDHFSGYMEMVIPIAIGLLIARINMFSSSDMGWREKILRFSEKGLALNSLLVFGIIGMSLSVVFSKSRSGMFLLIFSFILFFSAMTLYFVTADFQRKGSRWFIQSVFLVIIFISLSLGINATLERFSLDDLLHEQRPVFWKKTIEIFFDYPLVGSGLGTFGSIFPDFYRDGTPMRVYHAHNDYLEYLSELGLIGFGLFFGIILYLFIHSFKVWRKRRNPEIKGLGLGGLVAILCILFHSLTDFNLHIPANMLFFSAALSLTCVISTFGYKKTEGNKKSPHSNLSVHRGRR